MNDLISRQAAIETVRKAQSIGQAHRMLVQLPPAQPSVSKTEIVGDVISRQAAIDVTWEEPSYTDALNVLTEVRDKVKVLPSVTPQQTRWIPVSERLPEEHKEVLTCSSGGYIEIQSIEGTYGYWENQRGDWNDMDEVVAWMPLPEPMRMEKQ